MIMKLLTLALSLLVLQTSLSAQSVRVRVSAAQYWNYGWGDTFYFVTASTQEFLDDTYQKSWVPQHTAIPVVEVVLAQQFKSTELFLAFRHEPMKYRLRDEINPSWTHWKKKLDADLNLTTLAFGAAKEYRRLRVGIRGDIGVCWGELRTQHWVGIPGGNDTTFTLVGGNAARNIVGIALEISYRTGFIRWVASAGGVQGISWSPWPVKSVDGVYGPSDYYFFSEDRDLVLSAFRVGIGIEVPISFK